MKFEEGKSYKIIKSATNPPGPPVSLHDGSPHLCTKAVPESANVHASFDCDESPALMTIYTPEDMADFQEVATARNGVFMEASYLEAGNESNKLFGVDANHLKDKTIEVLRIGEGENTETAVLMAIRSGVLTSRDLAAFTAYTISEAYGKAQMREAAPDSLTALMEALKGYRG